MAMVKAVATSEVSRVDAMAHPTIFRENRSTTTARKSHPSWVGRYVMSLPHT
jgi:hypothetical protein